MFASCSVRTSGGGGGIFLACKDYVESLINHSPPAVFFYFLNGDQLTRARSTLLVLSGSVS